ncbi:serine/threonine-protein kinase [Muricoccus radiodurans]|uniref:serine/threonine-protein kinase n=1 Tax=Muricoccus radiodurans TaxID=2231721 RepID=UPI003CEB1C5F
MTEELPQRIGRYEVQGMIGRGAMGLILRAHDPELDRTVAIKLVARALLEGEEGADFLNRFRREARASGRCAHPNIVAIHDFGTHEGQPFLAMEFVDGTTLQGMVAENRRFSVAEASHLVGQVLDALDCAHAAGIVHRDIKPANILVLPGLRAKVADFGIARFGESDLTRHGDMIGTPSYMSPEACLGEGVDHRTDLFSTGTVLHELLSGTRAFLGGSVLETVRKVVDAPTPALPPGIVTGFPAVAAVVTRALAKRPADRFASAAEMAAALRAALSAIPAAEAGTVLAPPLPPRGPAQSLLDPSEVSVVERSLAAYVGPIAGAILRSATRQATSRDALLDALARSIDQPEERQRFRAEAARTLGASLAQPAPVEAAGPAPDRSAGAPSASPAELDRVRQALLPHIGPIAGVLVKRAAADGAPVDTVWQRAAAHIDNPAERAKFLARQTAS